jgi:hypothetical protein
MPVLPNLVPPSSITLQEVVDYARSFSECNPILPAGGYTFEPALTFANDVLQKILSQGLNWRWNASYVPLFLSNSLQQDYITNLTDVGWLTSAFRIDINNNTNTGNLCPKPLFLMETNRDMGLTPYQGNPSIVCFIPNNQCNFGTWTANTVYNCGYGTSGSPQTPIQQIVDANGNMLFLDTSIMGLTPNVQGYQGTNIPLPTPNPYNSTGANFGTSGSTAPELPPASPPGTTVPDGTLTWTVANPNGFAIRVNPLPAEGGFTWLFWIVYQRRAPRFKYLDQTISPVPDDLAYLFREGFVAKCLQHANSPRAAMQNQMWHEQIEQAIRAGEREEQAWSIFPDTQMSGDSVLGPFYPVGPASPFNYGYYYGY